MTRFDDFLNEQLKDPEFKKIYNALESELSGVQAGIQADTHFDMTHKRMETILKWDPDYTK